MKTVYFVRHGRTEGNEKKFYQHGEVPLSEKGKAQAAFVADRFSRIEIEKVISSDMNRAKETAEAIAAKTGQPLELQPLLRELVRPSEMRGKLHADPEARKILKFIKDNFESGKRYSDEENFYDLKNRAQEAKAYIESRHERALAIVTHGTFLKMLIGVMIFDTLLTANEFLALDAVFHSSNTGITTCAHEDGKWQIRTWNDYAHLG